MSGENPFGPKNDRPPQIRKSEKMPMPECGYAEGLEKCIATILKILYRKPNVVVAFRASGMHVGKSTLAADIASRLNERGIPVCIAHDEDDLAMHGQARIKWLTTVMPPPKNPKMVFVLDQMEYHFPSANILDVSNARDDRIVREACQEIGFAVTGIDLWVGIYRPDTPFKGTPANAVDILIRNADAHDK